MSNCAVCGDAYIVKGSDGEYIRFLCTCETDKTCFCDKPATQARLEDFSNPIKISEFVCQRHGNEEFVPYLKTKEQLLSYQVNPAAKKKDDAVVSTIPQAPALAKAIVPPSTMSLDPKNDPECQFMEQCLACNDVHLNADRVYVQVGDVYETRCPKCNALGPSRYLDDPVPTRKRRTNARKQVET